MKKIIITIVLTSFVLLLKAQFYIEPTLGDNKFKHFGFNQTTDSVFSYTTNSLYNYFFNFGLKTGYYVNPFLQINSSITSGQIVLGYMMYNKNRVFFGNPLQKGTSNAVQNISLSLAPEIEIPLRYGFYVSAFAGGKLNFNIRKKDEDIYFSDHENVPCLAELINNLDENYNQFYPEYFYGFQVRWHKLTASVKYIKVFNRVSVTDDVLFFGKKYPFKSQLETFNVMLGYRFYLNKKHTNITNN